MNLEEIKNTIEALEESSTTFGNCEKLASLYICREYLTKKSEPASKEPKEEEVEKEINDILPQYRSYCDIKRKYQLQEIGKEPVISSMKKVCTEIEEFIQILYSSTDMKEERTQIHNMLAELHSSF